MSKFGIVVIGYNRIDSIQRLMSSLLTAYYSDMVDLIISIDNSGTDRVEKYAESINWPYGKKIIRTFPERMGLKNHVLTCGNYINEYDLDALIVLEDDLFVAPDFYNFANQAVEKYASNPDVAGISLYSHSWNVNADRPFTPVYKGYDVFCIQYPQSWGQVWMKKQWNDFYQWYKENKFENLDKSRVPENVLGWPETSWLKYHVEYCIDANKYFVYPYQSLTTNYADAGTHYAFSTNKMQVPLSQGIGKLYTFPDELDDTSVYDAYYENAQLGRVLKINEDNFEVDLFGMKKKYSSSCRYLLTTGKQEYKVVQSFGLQMRPWELNVIYQVPGNEIYLYDMEDGDKVPNTKHLSLIHWVYDTRGEVILKRNFVDIMANEIFNKIRKK
jgi:hypothetical protein